jgi:acetoin utilization protein AcuB
MRISEVMSRAVATIEASEPAHAAVGRMLASKIRHLPVVDAQGTLVGIVTDRNLRHFLFSPGVFKKIGSVSADALLKAATVKQVMSSPAIDIGAEEDLEAAARLMVERRIGSLPVVENGRVVGIVTETDLLRQIVLAESRTPECEAIVVSFP